MLLLKLARNFKRERISYAVVGGFAVSLHGAIRGTLDLDIVLNLSEQDFVAAERVLRRMGLECRLPVSAKEVFDFREEYVRKRNLIAWSFYDPSKPIDQVDIILTENLRELRAQTMNVHGVPVSVVSLESLIQMKERSGRPQDKEDVHALRQLARKGYSK